MLSHDEVDGSKRALGLQSLAESGRQSTPTLRLCDRAGSQALQGLVGRLVVLHIHSRLRQPCLRQRQANPTFHHLWSGRSSTSTTRPNLKTHSADAQRLSQYLTEIDVAHWVQYSGSKGYHLFIVHRQHDSDSTTVTVAVRLSRRSSIRHRRTKRTLGLNTLDEQTTGDPKRLCRFPFTTHRQTWQEGDTPCPSRLNC